MRKPPRPELDADRLRHAAEQAVTALRDKGRDRQPPGSDALRQWHELQVSQVELDMQLQALAELQSECDQAEAGRERYAALYDQAPAGYLSLDVDGGITRANLAAGELLGVARDALPGKRLEQFVAPAAQAALRRLLAGVLVSGERTTLEVPLFDPRGATAADAGRQVHLDVNADPDARLFRVILTDIGTDRAREAARQRAFQVLEHLGEGVMVCDANADLVFVNPAFTTLTGYPVEEALGRNPRFLGRQSAHPPGYHAEAMRRLQAEGKWQGDLYNRRRDGTPYVVSMSITVIRDEQGTICRYIGVFSDVTAQRRSDADLLALSRELDARVAARTAELTAANRLLTMEIGERKRTETALQQSREQLRKLAYHLESVKEEERKRIARDLHDELGQNLLALRIDMSLLVVRTGSRHPRLRQRAQGALDQLDATIRSVRGIMNDLRPSVLDLGLQAALEWQAAEFRKRSGLACDLSLPPEAAFSSIAPDVEIVLFRCLQEALANVRRHARATHVAIALAVHEGQLTLSISDNGIGLAPEERAKSESFGLIGLAPEERAKSESFGLIGMAQRVQALGGRLEVQPYLAGGGCRLSLHLDLTWS
ncbi:histidine kinase [Duganella sp. Leaf126]|uniref:PAS domain-containing sensor histidine kinase n=1 Tax=Duganella sp. Leaf126 TaxID=1736266 RepID=UPI0006F759C3|nr:PAS domain-containing protein [Duganella sp. Leaf126]KQQ39942.1 histidine kinase [Duganella sp. Leaf126]